MGVFQMDVGAKGSISGSRHVDGDNRRGSRFEYGEAACECSAEVDTRMVVTASDVNIALNFQSRRQQSPCPKHTPLKQRFTVNDIESLTSHASSKNDRWGVKKWPPSRKRAGCKIGTVCLAILVVFTSCEPVKSSQPQKQQVP